MALLGTGFSVQTPANGSPVGLGALLLRDLKTRVRAFADVATVLAGSNAGKLKSNAVPGVISSAVGANPNDFYFSGAGTSLPTWKPITAANVPIGAIFPFPGVQIPAGFLECDGTAYSKDPSSPYYALSLALSGNFGETSTTFNVPNMLGRLPVGENLGGGNPAATNSHVWTVGSQDGEETHTLTVPEEVEHTHNVSQAWWWWNPDFDPTAEIPSYSWLIGGITEVMLVNNTSVASNYFLTDQYFEFDWGNPNRTAFRYFFPGGGDGAVGQPWHVAAHPNLQPVGVARYIIKYQ